MKASSRERHCELMALSVAITVCEQSARRVREELQSDHERHRAAKKGRSLV
jgi:hypothetical protein